MLRESISEATKEAMRSKDKMRLGTLRLISAAIKDKDIEARGSGQENGISDQDILAVLQKMVKQRKEAIEGAQAADRQDLVAQEEAEIEVIQGYLPTMLTQEETQAAIAAALDETGAAGLKDMGAVMANLRASYVGRMDFGAASGAIKAALQARAAELAE